MLSKRRWLGWALMGVGSALALGLIARAGYVSELRELRSSEYRRLQGIAELERTQIVTWRHERLAHAEVITENPLAVGRLEASIAAGKPTPDVMTWAHAQSVHADFSTFALLAADGRVLMTLGDPATAPDPALPGLTEVARRIGRPFVADLTRARGPKSPVVLDIVAPLARPDGALVGAVLLREEAGRFLFPLLATSVDEADGATALLVRREGEVASIVNVPRDGEDLGARVPLTDPRSPASAAARGEQGAFEGVDHRGVPVLAVLTPIPDTTWSIVSQEEVRAAEAPARERYRLITIVLAAVWILSGLVIALAHRARTAHRYRTLYAAERARRIAEARYVALLEHSSDAVILLDDAGTIVEVNQRAADLYGRTRDEMLGKPADILRPAELRQELPALLAALEREGRRTYETVHERKDGTRFPVELSVSSLMLEGGRHLLSLGRDLSERKQVERARAYEAELLANLNDAVIATDASLRLTAWNPAAERLYGWTALEVLGRPAQEVLAGPGAELDIVGAAELASTASTRHREYSIKRKDGTIAEVEVTIVGLGAGDRPAGYVSVHRDVGDRKRMQAKLMVADRMASLGTLAAGVAHEINNPLAYVLGNLSFVLDALATRGEREGDVVGALEEARQGAERVRVIVRDMGAFSRARDDSQRPVDVRAVLENALAVTRGELRHAARVSTQLGPVPRVIASEGRLGQAFVSLLVNAAQAIPPGRAEDHEISVCTREDYGRAVIEVRDTGVGIPPEILPRIFDPFFTTRTVGRGTGLGLAVCHGIVTALGGTIEVDSKPGRGSTFRIVLPGAVSAGEGARPARTLSVKPGRAARIMVVDDEPLVGRSVQRLLAGEHEVTALERGTEALTRLERGDPFDLILCDLMMPDLSGIDLYEALEQRHPETLARMVFITGGVFTERAREFLDRIPNPRLEKPFDLARLRQVVGDALAKPRETHAHV